MTKDEALTLALEALEESQTNNDTMEFWDRKTKSITAIKEALAQPDFVRDYGPLREDIAAWAQRRKSNAEERYFCPRCGKRTADLTTIHTCTPPTKIGAELL